MAAGVEQLRGQRRRGGGRLARHLPSLRDRLRRRDREQPAAGRPGSSCCCRPSSSRSRRRRVGPRATADSSTPTGCPRRSRRSPPAGRSCFSSGARTSRWADGCAGRLAASSVERASSCAHRRRSRPRFARLGARDVRIVPSGVEIPAATVPPATPTARAVRRAPLRGEGCAGAGARRRRGCRSSWSATARSGSCFPPTVRLRPSRVRSVSGSTALLWSSSPRDVRATGWPPARRWPTGGQWSRRGSGGWSTQSRTG